MRHVILCSLLLVVGTVNAQSPYRPFPEGNAGWVESHSWLNSNGGTGDSWSTAERTITFGTDSMINGTNYHRLLTRAQGTTTSIFQPWITWPFEEAQSTLCYFRQDIAARQVIVYDTLASQEVLWFDFTLGLGTYPATWYQNYAQGSVEVVALDSTLLNDGWHRTWVLGLPQNGTVADSAYCTMIEGVGATLGLHTIMGITPPFEWEDHLVCHGRDEAAVLPFGSTECDLSMSVKTIASSWSAPIVFPNPVVDLVTITEPVPGTAYHVLDMLGSIVRQGTVGQGPISLGALPPSNYTLRLTRRDGTVVSTRIVRL